MTALQPSELSPDGAYDATSTTLDVDFRRLPATHLGSGEEASHPGVLIIVQNLPVPFDRRVWLECRALVAAGYQVAVVCPKAPGDPSEEVIDGVVLYKYPQFSAKTKGAYPFEYTYSFLLTAAKTLRAWRRHRFAVIQACNPPDIFWPLALWFRWRGSVQFVFDHHDLCPELFRSRFPGGPRIVGSFLRFLERCTFRTADHVIATNDSYRDVAITRGAKTASQVTVVRTGPDAERLRRGQTDPSWRRGREHLVAYLGVMGPQDGVDLALHAIHRLIHRDLRRDTSFVFIGSGDCYTDLVRLVRELELEDYVEFVGRVPDEIVSSILSTADIGLCPDPKNPLNDVSTMNKTMEYMAFGVPVVAFDLRETRVSAGESALYATDNDADLFAENIRRLLDDVDLRRSMATRGRSRVVNELAWVHQVGNYLSVYQRLLEHREATGFSLAPTTRALEA
jgi:glycosyltransferase involved in cell wall biosynthesis